MRAILIIAGGMSLTITTTAGRVVFFECPYTHTDEEVECPLVHRGSQRSGPALGIHLFTSRIVLPFVIFLVFWVLFGSVARG